MQRDSIMMLMMLRWSCFLGKHSRRCTIINRFAISRDVRDDAVCTVALILCHVRQYCVFVLTKLCKLRYILSISYYVRKDPREPWIMIKITQRYYTKSHGAILANESLPLRVFSSSLKDARKLLARKSGTYTLCNYISSDSSNESQICRAHVSNYIFGKRTVHLGSHLYTCK